MGNKVTIPAVCVCIITIKAVAAQVYIVVVCSYIVLVCVCCNCWPIDLDPYFSLSFFFLVLPLFDVVTGVVLLVLR